MRTPSSAARPRRLPPLALAALGTALLLALVTDERTLGSIADEQQILSLVDELRAELGMTTIWVTHGRMTTVISRPPTDARTGREAAGS